MRAAGRRRDGGAATVLATSLVGLLVFAAVALVWVSGLVADHRTAQAAADLAALAGAEAIQQGHAACGAAGDIARANGASLRTCAVSGDEVRVTVTVRSAALGGLRPDVSARAHAGPAA